MPEQTLYTPQAEINTAKIKGYTPLPESLLAQIQTPVGLGRTSPERLAELMKLPDAQGNYAQRTNPTTQSSLTQEEIRAVLATATVQTHRRSRQQRGGLNTQEQQPPTTSEPQPPAPLAEPVPEVIEREMEGLNDQERALAMHKFRNIQGPKDSPDNIYTMLAELKKIRRMPPAPPATPLEASNPPATPSPPEEPDELDESDQSAVSVVSDEPQAGSDDGEASVTTDDEIDEKNEDLEHPESLDEKYYPNERKDKSLNIESEGNYENLLLEQRLTNQYEYIRQISERYTVSNLESVIRQTRLGSESDQNFYKMQREAIRLQSFLYSLNAVPRDYIEELNEINNNLPQMDNEASISILIPAYNEASRIEKTLESWTTLQLDNDGKPINPKSIEIIILVNRPNESRTFDETERVIEEFKEKHPEFSSSIHVIQKTFNFERKNKVVNGETQEYSDVRMGTIYRYLTDIAVLRNLQRIENGESEMVVANHVMRTGCADVYKRSPYHVTNILRSFENSSVEQYVSLSDYPPEIYHKIPLLFLTKHLQENMNEHLTSGLSHIGLGTYRTALYAEAGGFEQSMRVAEEIELSKRMRRKLDKRGKPLSKLRIRDKALNAIDDPKRDIAALFNGKAITRAYEDYQTNESIRSINIGEVLSQPIPEGADMTSENFSTQADGIFKLYLNLFYDPENAVGEPKSTEVTINYFIDSLVNLGFRKGDIVIDFDNKPFDLEQFTKFISSSTIPIDKIRERFKVSIKNLPSSNRIRNAINKSYESRTGKWVFAEDQKFTLSSEATTPSEEQASQQTDTSVSETEAPEVSRREPSAKDYAHVVLRKNVYGKLPKGSQVEGQDLHVTSTYFQDHGPDDLQALSTETYKNKALREMNIRIYIFESELPDLINSQIVSVVASPENSANKVLIIDFFQDKKQIDSKRYSPAHVAIELPGEVVSQLVEKIKADPDFLEEFYQAVFADLDSVEGKPGLRRAKSSGFYLITEDKSEDLAKAVEEFGTKGITEFLNSLGKHEYEYGPYGTGEAFSSTKAAEQSTEQPTTRTQATEYEQQQVKVEQTETKNQLKYQSVARTEKGHESRPTNMDAIFSSATGVNGGGKEYLSQYNVDSDQVLSKLHEAQKNGLVTSIDVLCDGLGRVPQSETASAAAATVFTDELLNMISTSPDMNMTYMLGAVVRKTARTLEEREIPGNTNLVASVIDKDGVTWIVTIGDAHAYSIKPNDNNTDWQEVKMLSKDQMELELARGVTIKTADGKQVRNINSFDDLIKPPGVSRSIDHILDSYEHMTVKRYELPEEAIIVLCSDGVYNGYLKKQSEVNRLRKLYNDRIQQNTPINPKWDAINDVYGDLFRLVLNKPQLTDNGQIDLQKLVEDLTSKKITDVTRDNASAVIVAPIQNEPGHQVSAEFTFDTKKNFTDQLNQALEVNPHQRLDERQIRILLPSLLERLSTHPEFNKYVSSVQFRHGQVHFDIKDGNTLRLGGDVKVVPAESLMKRLPIAKTLNRIPLVSKILTIKDPPGLDFLVLATFKQGSDKLVPTEIRFGYISDNDPESLSKEALKHYDLSQDETRRKDHLSEALELSLLADNIDIRDLFSKIDVDSALTSALRIQGVNLSKSSVALQNGQLSINLFR